MNDKLIESVIDEVTKDAPAEETQHVFEIRMSEQQLRVIAAGLAKSDVDEYDEFGDSVKDTLITMIDGVMENKDFEGVSSFVM